MLWIIYLFFIIYLLYFCNRTKEGFEWSPSIENKFNEYISTALPLYKFNNPIVKQQATEADVLYLLKNNHWFWDSDTIKRYKENIAKSPILSFDLNAAMQNSRQLYNNTAMKDLLFWNSPEGKFLLYGANLQKGENKFSKFKCDDYATGIIKTEYDGYQGWFNGYRNMKTTRLVNEELPNEIPGFSFTTTPPCNPCSRLTDPTNSCPFEFTPSKN
jgi:hypothetical protein